MTVEVAQSKVIPVLAYNGGGGGVENTSNDKQPSSSSQSPPEFVMIELNGELLAPAEFPSKETSTSILGSNGKQVELGKLQLDRDNKTPIMILGSHQLKGSIETLKEPFCLMEKKYNTTQQPKELESYQIVGVVKQKYLFNSYPKVIMR